MSLLEAGYTVRNEQRDFVEWHRGRSPYVFWALDADTPAVRARVAGVAAQLAGLLLPDYQRQPHVTLDVCGFAATAPIGVTDGVAAPEGAMRADDQFTAADLADQIKALLAGAPPPFVLELGAADSFASAPYLSIAPSPELQAIRACLAGPHGHRLWGHYVPHVTVGLYADVWPAQAVLARLNAGGAFEEAARDEVREPSAGSGVALPVERVCLMGYAPAVIGGPLTVLGEFDLRERCWRYAACWQSMLAELPVPAGADRCASENCSDK